MHLDISTNKLKAVREQGLYVLVIAALLLSVVTVAGAQTPGPVIFYTDLTSGPNSGGESVGGFAGAYVTIYGNFFGSSQGSSGVTLNGANCLRVVSWGAPWLWYQKIVVQLGASCASGNFVVTVGGQTSLEYPITLNGTAYHAAAFAVRSGNIRCVSTTGNDSNAGTFPSNCWATITKAAHTIGAGDIAYIENGVTATTQDPFAPYTAVVSLTSQGTSGNPIALVAYPGATVTINGGSSWNGMRTPAVNGPGPYWVIAGFNVTTGATSAFSFTVGNMRLIANTVSCTAGTGLAACAEVEFQNIFWYGNTMAQAGNANSSKQYHGLYMSQADYHSDVAWSDFHNVQGRSAIIFGNDQNPPYDMWDIHVHDNVIHDVRGEAINFSTVDPDNGPVEAYNNVMWNVGTGPANIDGSPEYVCVRVWSKTTPTTVFTNLFNNTCYNGGSQGGPDAGALSLHDPALVVDNIFYQTSGHPYLNSSGCNFRSGSVDNDFFGTGAAPSCSGLSNSLSVDPKVVSTSTPDFHLQTGSPMIDAGLTIATLKADHDGRSRPQGTGYDIGAYEYFTGGSSVQIPNPPTNLMVAVQ